MVVWWGDASQMVANLTPVGGELVIVGKTGKPDSDPSDVVGGTGRNWLIRKFCIFLNVKY